MDHQVLRLGCEVLYAMVALSSVGLSGIRYADRANIPDGMQLDDPE